MSEVRQQKILRLERELEALKRQRDVTVKDVVPGNYFTSGNGSHQPVVVLKSDSRNYEESRNYIFGGCFGDTFSPYSAEPMTRLECFKYLMANDYSLAGKIKTTIEYL